MKSLSVLVVDDDPANVRTLTDILEYRDFFVVGANSGLEALELINARSFACVITDVKMPGMDGVQLLEEIREISPATKVVLMTAYTAIDKLQKAKALGVYATLIKPINLDDVFLLLEHIETEQSPSEPV